MITGIRQATSEDMSFLARCSTPFVLLQILFQRLTFCMHNEPRGFSTSTDSLSSAQLCSAWSLKVWSRPQLPATSPSWYQRQSRGATSCYGDGANGRFSRTLYNIYILYYITIIYIQDCMYVCIYVYYTCGGWKKSCTSWYMVYPCLSPYNPIIYSVSWLPNGCQLVQDFFQPLYLIHIPFIGAFPLETNQQSL